MLFRSFEGAPQLTKEQERFRDLRKAKKADEKRIKELTDKLDALTKGQNERVIKDVLEKKGVNPKVMRLVQKDLEGDFTEEAVNNWLEDNAEIFGISINSDAQKVSNEDLNALRQQDRVTQGATTPDRNQDLEYRIENASSPDELAQILYSSNS